MLLNLMRNCIYLSTLRYLIIIITGDNSWSSVKGLHAGIVLPLSLNRTSAHGSNVLDPLDAGAVGDARYASG